MCEEKERGEVLAGRIGTGVLGGLSYLPDPLMAPVASSGSTAAHSAVSLGWKQRPAAVVGHGPVCLEVRLLKGAKKCTVVNSAASLNFPVQSPLHSL